MKTIKTGELSDVALDYFVCKAAGLLDAYRNYARPLSFATHWMSAGSKFLHPSTDWANGGPILERERISVEDLPAGINIGLHPTFKPGDLWEAKHWPSGEDEISVCGPTYLIAAMRCYVMSKRGETVEVSEELLP